MKIIIVGAGVSGLSTYLLLQRHLSPFLDTKIVIYDSHISFNPSSAVDAVHTVSDSAGIVGNSIILPPSAIRLLHKIDERLYELFKSRGFENSKFTLRTARGHTLARISTDDGVLPREYSISCPRWVLWECLQEVVGKDKILQGKIVNLELKDGLRPRVVFEDGRFEEADLVVGADGAHSIVRKALFCDRDEQEYGLRFEGYCGVGTFLDMVTMPAVISKHASVVVTFGPTGSFGYASAAPLGQRQIGWWSNWPTDQRLKSSYCAPEEVRRQLRERHGTWKDPVIQMCISDSQTDRVYPLWTTPDLPHWGERGCVLLGDAAHTLQATSGQGAAQALEDSVTFALLLKHYLQGVVNLPQSGSGAEVSPTACLGSVDAASKGLYELRHERVASIRKRARNLYARRTSSSNLFWEYYQYLFIFIVTNFPTLGRWIIGNSFKEPREWSPEVECERYLGSVATANAPQSLH